MSYYSKPPGVWVLDESDILTAFGEVRPKIDYGDFYMKNRQPGLPKIKRVIFNDPATIVLWEDGTKTVVKKQKDDKKKKFDKEKGLALAIAKKALGNQGNYFETFKKWCD